MLEIVALYILKALMIFGTRAKEVGGEDLCLNKGIEFTFDHAK